MAGKKASCDNARSTIVIVPLSNQQASRSRVENASASTKARQPPSPDCPSLSSRAMLRDSHEIYAPEMDEGFGEISPRSRATELRHTTLRGKSSPDPSWSSLSSLHHICTYMNNSPPKIPISLIWTQNESIQQHHQRRSCQRPQASTPLVWLGC